MAGSFGTSNTKMCVEKNARIQNSRQLNPGDGFGLQRPQVQTANEAGDVTDH